MPRLDVHVYDSDPQRRFLLADLKKYREGDTLANGAVIEEILPEHVDTGAASRRIQFTIRPCQCHTLVGIVLYPGPRQ